MLLYSQQVDAGFARIAPFLTHPLVLCGFTVMLFYGVLKALLGARILRPIGEKSGAIILRLLLKYGFIVAVLIILLGFGLEGYRTWLKSSDHPEVIRQIARTLNPIRDVSLSFEMDIPLDDPSLKTYLARLDDGIKRAQGRYAIAKVSDNDGPAVAKSLELTKDLGISLKHGDPDKEGFLRPIDFNLSPESPLLPKKTGDEALAYMLVMRQMIILTVYTKPIDPQTYAVPPLSPTPPDWSFETSRSLNPKAIHFEYPNGRSTIRLVAEDIPVEELAHTDNVVSISDLAGAQVFIHPNAHLDVDMRFQSILETLKMRIRLVKLSIGVNRIKMDLDLNKATSVSNNLEPPPLVYSMPTNLE